MERVFAFRSAAISAAKLADWVTAITFYSKAREEAMHGKDSLRITALGLLGDLAGAQLRAGNLRGALKTMIEALQGLEALPFPLSPIEHSTRALISHVPVWMDFELFKEGRPFDLPPGVCSRSEPHAALVERPLPPIDVGYYQLAALEQRVGVDAGISHAVESWPDNRRIPVMEALLAKARIDRSVTEHDAGAFERALGGYMSSVEYFSAHRGATHNAQSIDSNRGALPQVGTAPDGSMVMAMAANAVLAFATVAAVRNAWSALDELIHGLRASQPGSKQLNDILEALEGRETQGGDASAIVARMIARFRSQRHDLVPDEVFVVQCRLLDWSRQSDFMAVIAPALVGWIADSWRDIGDNQAFMVRNPRTTVPEILRTLSDDGTAVQKAARALLAAESAVRTPLHEDLRAIVGALAADP